MLQRRATIRLCLLGLVWFSSPAPTQAQNCRGVLNASESVRWRGYVDDDGKVHYSIGYASGVSQPQIDAIQSGINQWNHHSALTGIVLEEAGGRPDILFRPGSSDRPCAEYDPTSSTVWFNAVNMAWAGAHPHIAGRVYAHEIGHALGVDHKTGYSIMAPGNPTWTCFDVAAFGLADAQPDDAEDLRACAFAAHEGQPYGPPPAYFWEEHQPNCYILWYREEYWAVQRRLRLLARPHH